jgi:uncharacterized protein (DUF1501 family)
MPQSPLTGNRFLVTTYKFGGESLFAKLVPLGTTNAPTRSQLEEWWQNRPAHRYGENAGVYSQAVVLAALANKLGTSPDFALHPNYSGLIGAGKPWTEGDLAIVPHCGVLEEPLPDRLTDIPDYRTAYRLPLGVGAHDAFQEHHINMNGTLDKRSAGWIGQVMDTVSSTNELATSFSNLHTIVINPNVPHYQMHRGDVISPFTLPRFGPAGPSGSSAGLQVAMTMHVTATSVNVRNKLAEAISLAASPTSPRHQRWKSAFQTALDGSNLLNPVQITIPGAGGPLYGVDAAFGQVTDKGWWYSMFHRIARVIEAAVDANAGALPIRMAIAASIGDYDTHGSEKVRFEGDGTYTSLAQQYGDGLAAFRNAMIAIGVWDDVVVTDPTDFGRTLWTQGGAGTDHAWAYAMFIAGGKVRGAGVDGSTGILGPWPAAISVNGTGTRDINLGGIMYPYRSLEEVYDQILDWFGLTVAERNTIMVNRTRFSNFCDVLDI